MRSHTHTQNRLTILAVFLCEISHRKSDLRYLRLSPSFLGCLKRVPWALKGNYRGLASKCPRLFRNNIPSALMYSFFECRTYANPGPENKRLLSKEAAKIALVLKPRLRTPLSVLKPIQSRSSAFVALMALIRE